jgi:cell division protein FtsB
MADTSRRTGPAGSQRPVRRVATTRPDRTRPAAAARPRTDPQVATSSTLWIRVVVLAAMVAMLAVMVVPTLRSFLSQQAQISAVRDTVAEQQADITSLEAEQRKWSDPAYIEQQARERLKFVRIGDRAYSVIEPVADTAATRQPSRAPVVSAKAVSDKAPWYGRLWQSVQVADQPTAGVVKTSSGSTGSGQ